MVGSFVYNLPFGSGERFGGDATGVKNAIIGGWQVNGIATWQRGFPLTVTAADLGGLNDTQARTAPTWWVIRTLAAADIDRWFNTDAFAQPGFGVLGNSGRNILRGPDDDEPRFLALQELRASAGAPTSSSGWSRSMCSTIRSSTACRRT